MPPDSPRIAELRRRVHADPASIAFAQLAEEYRRAGNYQEAVSYCRAGLARHPGYLSARVTLGRALSELGGLDEAVQEFELVLKSAPDNLAAIRGVAEIHQRRGDMAAALEYYKRALVLARFDPELEETVNRIGREMGTVAASQAAGGLSFEEARSELLTAAARISARDESATSNPAPSAFAREAVEGELRRDGAGMTSGDEGGRDASAFAREVAEGDLRHDPAEAAAGREGGTSRRLDLIDFDALLASLGVPDATPPPVVNMLVPQVAQEVPPSRAARPPSTGAGVPPDFSDVERELRAFDAPAAPADDAVASVVDELEAWVRVLQNERPRHV